MLQSGITISGGDDLIRITGGDVTVSGSSLSNPSASQDAIEITGGSLMFTGSSISGGSGNRAIAIKGGAVTVSNSTITDLWYRFPFSSTPETGKR